MLQATYEALWARAELWDTPDYVFSASVNTL